MKHAGGCHCGQVRFEFEAPTEVELVDCNCSVCVMTGYQHLILPRDKFTLLCSDDNLTLYQFNQRIAKHYFCSNCGIKPFYIPRSNPDGISINFRCVDRRQFLRVSHRPFDGKNFEANASELAHLSK
mgnify:CR=1 FL=1|tara:strand:+ start:75 stop:455 length:381 start_codon:yes stop_codon:yes gene_type:complete